MKSLRQLSFMGLTASLVLTSCTTEKRLYMSGYHIETIEILKQNADKKETRNQIINKNEKTISDENWIISVDNSTDIPLHKPVNLNNQEYTVATKTIFSSNNPKTIIPSNNGRIKNEDECAEIIMRNGDIIKGYVIEVGVSEIKYKKCDFLNGPTYALNKPDVFLIKYPNGTTDIFKEEKSETKEKSQPINVQEIIHRYPDRDNRKTDGLGLAGFIISLVGGFFIPIVSIELLIFAAIIGFLAMTFGVISTDRINRYPEKLKGKGFGITSMILGILTLIGVLVILRP